MEQIRNNKHTAVSKKVISIADLGYKASDMLDKWKELEKLDTQLSFREFPTVDIYQCIHDISLMQLLLEFAVEVENHKKKIAKQRQAEGIAKAREKGIKLGRREKEIPENFVAIYEQVIAKKMTLKKATELLDVDYKTYKKWVGQYKANK